MDKQKFISRDNTRTPFQWDASLNAGFTTGKPWIKVNPNYKTVNVVAEAQNPLSELSYFKKMVALRKSSPGLVYGDYQVFDINNPDVYCYARTDGQEKMLIILNFSAKAFSYPLDQNIDISSAKVLMNNYNDSTNFIGNEIHLKPWQALVFKLN